MIFALLLGGETYGFLGALLSLPIAAMVRETVVYLRRHLVLEPWGTSVAAGRRRATARAPMSRVRDAGIGAATRSAARAARRCRRRSSLSPVTDAWRRSRPGP